MRLRPVRPALILPLLVASCGWYEDAGTTAALETAELPSGTAPTELPASAADGAPTRSGVADSAPRRSAPRQRLEAIEIHERPDARPGHFVDGAVVAYFEAASIDELESIARRVVESGLPGVPPAASPVALRGDRRYVDAARPIGVALTLPWDRTRPCVTTIVPVTDRTAFLASVEAAPDLHATAAGEWVALGDDPVTGLRETPHPITEDLPSGSLRARADLGPLLERFGPLAEQGFEQLLATAQARAQDAEGSPELELVREQVELARMVLGAAERLDASITFSGADLTLDLALAMRAESELAAVGGAPVEGLRELALCIDPVDPVVVLGALDAPFLRERIDGWTERLESVLPTAAGADPFTEVFAALQVPAFAASGDAGLGATRFTSYYRLADPQAFVERVARQLDGVDVDALGIQRIGPRSRTVGKTPVTEYLFARRLGDVSPFSRNLLGFFDDGLRLRLARQDGIVALVTGGDDGYLVHSVVRLGKEKTRLAEGLDTALERVGSANPCFALRLDLARVAQIAFELAAAGSDAPGPVALRRDPVLLTVYGGIEGRVWRVGATFDFVAYASLMRSQGGLAQAGAAGF